jgi:hypothetical protein
MPTDPRTPHDQWASRGPALAAPQRPPLDAHPVVTFRTDPDSGDAWHVRLGAFRGPARRERHTAEADRDALAAALAPLLGLSARLDALLASPEARDAVAGRCAAPASAALAVLRWVRGPVAAAPEGDGGGPPSTLRPGDAPTLDRVIAGAGCAIVAGEEDGQ